MRMVHILENVCMVCYKLFNCGLPPRVRVFFILGLTLLLLLLQIIKSLALTRAAPHPSDPFCRDRRSMVFQLALFLWRLWSEFLQILDSVDVKGNHSRKAMGFYSQITQLLPKCWLFRYVQQRFLQFVSPSSQSGIVCSAVTAEFQAP